MRHLFRLTILLTLTCLATTTIYPCQCNNVKANKKLKEAHAVFVGEVIEISQNDKDALLSVTVKFKVETYWKGIKKPFITIMTAPDKCCACGLKVDVGVRYLIYAYQLEDGRLETNSCASDTIASERTRAELKILGKGKLLH